jgi:dTDP-glucose 4,6-dehydratase
LKSEVGDIISNTIGDIDIILHLAAGSHVDRSIEDPMSFVMDNVVGTANILNYARKANIERMIYFSTDEVFGPAPEGVNYKEWDRYNSGNPYSASKAGAEELCLAFHNTYKLPVIVTHCMNVFGERQHPEKYIPMVIRSVLTGDKVTIHANSDLTKAGSRYYIHARNVAKAVSFLLEHGEDGEKYNIVGEKEVDNLQLAQIIADHMGLELNYELVDFHGARPGHDLRYALCGEKMEGMGWELERNLEKSLHDVVDWSLANRDWIGA